ncbi:DarT ssDNA thymidine ADP-ribosyltransferase family protein [Nocardiopsis kunsanensis]|uniref:DarT ssDNA thymidine ADP-ribosyltransferase family protein n=1 Tax=Nocardiopsis kunsanensis TaxID=141693 RepID=UPI00034D5088|nr:DarT ssDNA thymidine ADP-ribosyltransferase family protein [Nocardiopsis kunsanensis]
MTALSVTEALRAYGSTRLAHFTPSMNLAYIVEDGRIRSSADLAQRSPEYFSPTDRERFDGHPDRICCTFEYPNGYYLAQAQRKAAFTNYPDWVCLFLDISLVTLPGTLFAAYNAAKGKGAHLKEGGAGLAACFAEQVGGWRRSPTHTPGVATDLQAEVLVPGPISSTHISAVAVPTAEKAAAEWARLSLTGMDPSSISWVVSPHLFDKEELRRRLHGGIDIPLTPWAPTADGGTA